MVCPAFPKCDTPDLSYSSVSNAFTASVPAPKIQSTPTTTTKFTTKSTIKLTTTKPATKSISKSDLIYVYSIISTITRLDSTSLLELQTLSIKDPQGTVSKVEFIPTVQNN